jgi:tRNA pseudouridine55 synthase
MFYMSESIPELLLIDKPKGITSFDVIRRLRRKLGVKKMGHAGTLDPLATGLMIIGVGPGTKRLAGLVKLNKVYLAEVLIGERRSTGDMEGEILEEKTVDEPAEILLRKISATLEDMIGENALPVSAYSAIKINGSPLYKQARKAEETSVPITELPIRVMKVFDAKLFKVEVIKDRVVAVINFKVGSGTYVRSLAEEIGRRIDYPATLQNLRRLKVGDFDIEMAQQIDDIK